MQNRLIHFACVGAVTLTLSTLLLSQDVNRRPDSSDGGSGKQPDSQLTDPHDFSGVWLWSRQFSAQVSPTVPPMTPWAKAKFDANKPSFGPRAVPPALGNDPLGNCDPLGIPRIIFYNDSKMQFVQTPGRTLQFFEWNHVWRDIWTDGRELPKDPDPTYLGTSIGKWEGDTFVVESAGFDDRTWLDHFGDPHTDEMRLVERYRRVDRKTLELTMTLTDPKAYTQTWVGDKKVFTLDPDPNDKFEEAFCVPSVEQAFNNSVRNPAATGQAGPTR